MNRRRKTVFRLAAIALALSPFLLLELTLRGLGLPENQTPMEAISEANQSRRLFVANQESGRFEIAADRLEYFRPDHFQIDKPDDGKRIFVLGGSTVAGRPYEIETAFSTWLKLSLQAAQPSTQWEVVNCGGVSYASYRVLAILAEVLQHEPDLIVIYCGHNEFLERCALAPASAIPTPIATLVEYGFQLRSMQWISQQLQGDSNKMQKATIDLLSHEVDTLLDQTGLQQYQRGRLEQPLIERAYLNNMSAMIELCCAGDVPLVIAVPARNLASCPPFKSQVDPSLSAPQSQHLLQLLNEAADGHCTLSERLERLAAAARIDSKNPAIAYQRGRLLAEQGEWEQARQLLAIACDNDICPLRMRSSGIRRLGDLLDTGNVPHVDIDQLFRSESAGGLVGENLMVDHVHPTISGHQKIALAIYDELCEMNFIQPGKEFNRVRREAFAKQLEGLGEAYYARGKARLEGLRRWAAGRAARQRTAP